MEDYVERMVEERSQLEERLDKLVKFLNSEDSKKIPIAKFDMLTKQCDCMVQYLRLLTMRLELEKNERLVDWKTQPAPQQPVQQEIVN